MLWQDRALLVWRRRFYLDVLQTNWSTLPPAPNPPCPLFTPRAKPNLNAPIVWILNWKHTWKLGENVWFMTLFWRKMCPNCFLWFIIKQIEILWPTLNIHGLVWQINQCRIIDWLNHFGCKLAWLWFKSNWNLIGDKSCILTRSWNIFQR